GLSEPALDEEETEAQQETLNTINEFNFKPKGVKAYLDRFVIGQDEAKKALSIAICDHYNYLKDSFENEDENYQKQNVLVLGPTGVGKTYLVKLISKLIGVPFVKADATRFSEVGYMGANVDDIIRDLVQKAGGDKKLASKGIVYVDEVDKLASQRDERGRDVSGRGVQFGFLRLLENSDVDLNSSHDMASQFKTFMSFQKKGKADKEIINTKDILFIFSGAFHGLEDIIKNRLQKKSVGIHTDKTKLEASDLFEQATAEDLVKFGFEHEFIGRLPIRVNCQPLEEDDLYQILTESEHSIVKQYQRSFSLYGIKLKFTKGALKVFAQRAYLQKNRG
ncbi:MAG: AAA family ATPase, partial [Bdellovibrionales bacterium]|nr:AAA family ATPase [Bdellovibrionales bacterium]